MGDLQRSPFNPRCPRCGEALCCSDVQDESQSATHSGRYLFLISLYFLQVTYDLHEMNVADIIRVRDTLLTALQTYHAGPRSILTQLCLALSGLALQLPSWEDPMQDMIDSFGRNPATVPAFLQFLTLLPEELCTNTKIPVTVRYAVLLLSCVFDLPSPIG